MSEYANPKTAGTDSTTTNKSARQRQMEKQREKMLQGFQSERERILKENQVHIGSDKFVTQVLDVEAELKRDTVGLVQLDDFQRIREQLEKEKKRKEEELERNAKGRPVKKVKRNLLDKGKLSFDVEDDEDDGDFKQVAKPRTFGAKKKVGKDPTVDTSFLPDKEREAREAEERERLKQEWLAKQEEIKQELVHVDVSFWDGHGHGGHVVLKKGDTIGQLLAASREVFPQIRKLPVENLLFIKEDTILPHHYTLYDFIVNKVRGKSGPLYSYVTHVDVRMQQDVDTEKAAAYPAKIVEKAWYEKNKRIFPASRWEVYDPNKPFDKRDALE